MILAVESVVIILPLPFFIGAYLVITFQNELGITQPPIKSFDTNGIPIEKHYINGEYSDWKYNPLSIAIYGKYLIDEYNIGNISTINLIFNIANWFVKNAKTSLDYYFWTYDFQWKIYNLPEGWILGLAQGKIMIFLQEAFQISHNSTYEDLAYKAFLSFKYSTTEGGVTYNLLEGGKWFEEYVSDSIKPYVLNGHMGAVTFLYYYYNYTNHSLAKDLFEQGLIGLKNRIHSFDNGGWTRYDLVGNLASKTYHHRHVTLCSELYNITNDVFFENYYFKWKAYEESDFNWFHRYKENPLLISYLITTGIFLAIDVGLITSQQLIKKKISLNNHEKNELEQLNK